MVAAPINLVDVDDILGTYASNLPSVGGSEGLGIVEHVGEGVRQLSVGDWVIPNNKSFGTNVFRLFE
jgi:trans-2-enoyl-CoA reductase